MVGVLISRGQTGDAVWGSRNGELWRAGPKLSPSLGTLSREMKAKSSQRTKTERPFWADSTACVKACSVQLRCQVHTKDEKQAGVEGQVHNTDSPTKNLGLDSVCNKKPWQTPKPCTILETAPKSFTGHEHIEHYSCLITLPTSNISLHPLRSPITPTQKSDLVSPLCNNSVKMRQAI